MDERLKIRDGRRELPAGFLADTPLVTLGWRALQAEHQRRARERQLIEAEMRRVREMIVRIGDEAHALRRLAREGGGASESLAATAQRLEDILAGVGARVVSLEGEAYTSELMNVLENVAQRADAEATQARIAEVILPAILWRGEILRMGKVVIGLPLAAAKAAGIA